MGWSIRLFSLGGTAVRMHITFLLLVAWIGSHAETDLAQSLGAPYTEGSCELAETYLSKFG